MKPGPVIWLALAAALPPGPALEAASSEADQARAEMFYGVAEGNYLSGNPGAASTALRQALKADPGHSLSALLLGRIQLEREQPEAALETVDLALDADAGAPDLQLLRAVALGTLGRSAEAERALADVLAVADPEDRARIEAKRLRAVLDATGEDWDEAANAYLAGGGRRNDPASVKLAAAAWAARSKEAGESGDFDSALAYLDEALAHLPVSAADTRTRLQLLRGQTRARAGDPDGAINDLREITVRDPDNLEASLILAALYANAEQWEALDTLVRPITEDPRLADIALYLEGRSAFARGRIGTARARFEAALDLLSPQADSLRPVLGFYRGWTLLKLERREAGDAAILNALELGFRPESEAEVVVAGRTLLRAGRIDEVIRYAGRLALDRSDNPDLWTLLGRAHEAEGERTLALSAYTRALECEVGHRPARVLRAGLLRAIGDLEGAAIDYRLALDGGDDPALDYALGLVLLQSGSVGAAVGHLGSAADALPDNAAVQLLHALCADATGSDEAALRSLARYRTAVPERPAEPALLLAFHLAKPGWREAALETLRSGLKARPIFAQGDLYELLADYYAGDADRQTLLDAAGNAVSAREARRQVCEIAYWMARDDGDRSLLEICVATGETDRTEYQLARWQLAAVNAGE